MFSMGYGSIGFGDVAGYHPPTPRLNFSVIWEVEGKGGEFLVIPRSACEETGSWDSVRESKVKEEESSIRLKQDGEGRLTKACHVASFRG